ncbi:type II toxin-antitoxin system RelE/ParE family toxin, partial [Candidatus Venteria ishoeyi]|uniref:type II toxin-antitoxin system RelE/ParE family toxin n=1 Tax=Candidatus Venteria ishoeyi TaxID=1899563 RepID=UPI000CDF04A7
MKTDAHIEVLQTAIFARKRKKLKTNQLKDLDNAIKAIIKNPTIDEQKKGDLQDIWVYKFRMAKQESLLTYQ